MSSSFLKSLNWHLSKSVGKIESILSQSFSFWNFGLPFLQKFHNFGTYISSFFKPIKLNFKYPIKIFIIDPSYNAQPIFKII